MTGTRWRGLPRRAVVVASVALGGALLLTALVVWVRAAGTSALSGSVPLEVAGSVAAPAVTASGLAMLAAGVAALLVGRGGRLVVAAALGAASVVVVVSAGGVLRDARAVATAEAARLTGVPVLSAEAVVTAAPWVAVCLGLVGLVVTLALLPGGGAWERRTERHERPAAGRPGSDGPVAGGTADDRDVAALWDEQSRERDADA